MVRSALFRECPGRKQSMVSPLRSRRRTSGSSSKERNRSFLWLCCCLLAIHSLRSSSNNNNNNNNNGSNNNNLLVQFEVSAFVVVETTPNIGAKNTIFATHRHQHHHCNTRNTRSIIAESATRSRAFATTTAAAIDQASRQSSLREAVPIELGETETAPAEATTTTAAAAPSLGSPNRINDQEYVWIWEEENDNRNGGERSWNLGGSWRRPEGSTHSNGVVSSDSAQRVTTLVRNWCEDFVLALDLCPWAKASIQTRGAMRFFLVPPRSKRDDDEPHENDDDDEQQDYDELRMRAIVDDVAGRFQAEILDPATAAGPSPEEGVSLSKGSALEKAAIYFVVFLSPEPTGSTSESSRSLPDSYPEFINWFMDLEDHWPEEFDDVIIAPFHPSWEFGSAEEDADEICLDYEKRSPVPLVTLVSTKVVEKAGMAATEAIGERNREILLGIEDRQRQQTKEPTTRGQDGKEPTTTTPTTPTPTTLQQTKSHKNASVAELWRSAVYGKKDTNTAS